MAVLGGVLGQALLASLTITLTSTQFNFRKYNTKNITDMVAEQYLDIPYPPFTQQDMFKEVNFYRKFGNEFMFSTMSFIDLDQLKSIFWKGKPFRQEKLKFLVAGGGTGNSINVLAQDLSDFKAEVHYLDLSRSSMEIAQKRAKIRNIDNIKWHNDRIENIPNLNIGKVDFVETSGVLHHMADPQLGLQVIADSLKDDGGMALMVYGKLGRTGLYHVQDIMKIVNEGLNNRFVEINNTWKVLESFPHEDLEIRLNNMDLYEGFGLSASEYDAEIYDSYNHKQDNGGFTFKELFEYINKTGLFIQDISNSELRKILDPLQIKDIKFREFISTLDKFERWEVMERVTGKVIKHDVYLSKKPDVMATTDNLNLALFSEFKFPAKIQEKLMKEIEAGGLPKEVLVDMVGTYHSPAWLRLQPHTSDFIRALDTGLSIGEIYQGIGEREERAGSGQRTSVTQLKLELDSFIEDFRKFDGVVLLEKTKSHDK